MPQNHIPFFSSVCVTGFLSSLHLFFKTGAVLPLVLCFLGWFFSIVLWSSGYQLEEEGGWEVEVLFDSLFLAIVIFILSEVLFFVSFFWGWFNFKWSPGVELGALPVPFGVKKMYQWGIPLVNTSLLLNAACLLTYSHVYFISRVEKDTVVLCLMGACFLTLGFLFTQLEEYYSSWMTISDSTYGSLFYLLTGLHGCHVLVGLVFLLISLMMISRDLSDSGKHSFFELSVYYYHFVDVVWLFLWAFVYLIDIFHLKSWGVQGFYL